MAESASEPSSSRSQTHPFRAIVDSETIQTTVSLVHALVDECHVHFDPDGVRLRAMDPATVAYVDVTLDSEAFESYEAGDGHIGVNLARLADVVGMADRDQPVAFELDQETRRLEIRIDGLAYTLALIDPETIRSPPDRSTLEFELPAGAVTASKTVSRAVNAADMVSDHVTLGVDDDAGVFYAEAEGDTDDVSLEVPASDLAEFEAGDAHSLFSIDYLAEIDRALPSGVDVDLRLGTEKPLALQFAFASDAGAVEYLVSPRIASH